MSGAKDQRKSAPVVAIRPEAIRDLVRRLAIDSANVQWSDHALERMEERDIRDHVVLDVLRKGELKGELRPGRSPGEWTLKMVLPVKGRREVGVVVVTMRANKLRVKTAEWEDLK